jgi:uncharacterized OsmC-like protein
MTEEDMTDKKSGAAIHPSQLAPSAAELLGARKADCMRLYRTQPERALTTDVAHTQDDGERIDDPLHTLVVVGAGSAAATLPIAVHEHVGGLSDRPVPGDVLCAALASCLDSTIRVVAQHTGIALARLGVRVEADVDVRGTLGVAPVPVGFQRLRVVVDLAVGDGAPPTAQSKLVTLAEHCCVVLQTLRQGVAVGLTVASPSRTPSKGDP